MDEGTCRLEKAAAVRVARPADQSYLQAMDPTLLDHHCEAFTYEVDHETGCELTVCVDATGRFDRFRIFTSERERAVRVIVVGIPWPPPEVPGIVDGWAPMESTAAVSAWLKEPLGRRRVLDGVSGAELRPVRWPM